MGAGGVQGDTSAHPASSQFFRNRLNRVIGDSNKDVVCQGGNVADRRRLYFRSDEGSRSVRVIGCSAGDSNRRQAGISEEPAERLGNSAGPDDRRARSVHLIAENVRFSQPVTPVTTSALTLRSVSAPYSFTSPVTAGTIR